MSAVYEILGYIAYWTYIYFMIGMLAFAFAQSASYMALCIVAVFRHGRWRQVRWLKVPGEFLHHWRKYLNDGAPDSIESKYAKWEGVLKWTIYPKDAQPSAAPAGKDKP